MDLRKLKTLIDLVSESNVSELEITEAEGKVRIVKGGGGVMQVAAPVVPVAPAPVALPVVPAPVAEAPAPAPVASTGWTGIIENRPRDHHPSGLVAGRGPGRARGEGRLPLRPVGNAI